MTLLNMPSPTHNHRIIVLHRDLFCHGEELHCHILMCIHIFSSTSGLTQHMRSGKHEFAQQPDLTMTPISSHILPKTPFSSRVPPPQTPFSYNPSCSAPTNHLQDVQPLFSDGENLDTDEHSKISSSTSSTSSSSPLSSSPALSSSALHSTTSHPSSQAHTNEDDEMDLRDNIHVEHVSSPVLHDFPMFSPSPSAPSSSPGSPHHIDLDGSDINISTPHSCSNDDDRGTAFDNSIGRQHLMEEDDIDKKGVPVTRVYHPYLNDKCSLYI